MQFDQNIKKVCLVGYYGFGNIGDDIILISAVNKYANFLGLDTRILVNGNDYVEKMLKIFGLDNKVILYDRWNLSQISEAVYYSDATIFAGGGIFQDKTSLKSFIYYFYIALISKLMKKKIIIERNSIGDFNTKIAKFLFKYVLSWAESVSVRDSLSLDFLQKNYPTLSSKFKLEEDFALSEFAQIIRDFSEQIVKDSNQFDILFVLRKFDEIQKLSDLITKIRDQYKVKIIVFQENDLYDLKEYFQDAEYLGEGKVLEIIKLIESSKLVISNRLHGIVLSNLLGVKCIGINIDSKIRGFCLDKNIECLDCKDLDNLALLIKKVLS
ncbi:MAG: polysaccharide pyruvyl transferase family protein [bacterium]